MLYISPLEHILMMSIVDTQTHAARPPDPRYPFLLVGRVKWATQGTCFSSYWGICQAGRIFSDALVLHNVTLNQAKSLQFLDLSQNSLDKKSIEYIVAALETAPEPGLISLRLDDCSLRPAALEALCTPIMICFQQIS